MIYDHHIDFQAIVTYTGFIACNICEGCVRSFQVDETLSGNDWAISSTQLYLLFHCIIFDHNKAVETGASLSYPLPSFASTFWTNVDATHSGGRKVAMETKLNLFV